MQRSKLNPFPMRSAKLVPILAGLCHILTLPAKAAEPLCCGPISAQGQRLEAVLDGMNVESLWLVHEHINWQTGKPDKDADYEGPGTATHCSAFAAAVGQKVGVYLLRPPEHSQIQLAYAQPIWFHSDQARQAGWRPVDGPKQAQTLANQGNLVVVAYENPDPKKNGHVAIVRPAPRPQRLLDESGPLIIQAGQHNYRSASAKTGFQATPGVWPKGVHYYMHAIEF
jgi:hypothetical protein